ncbi:hypothetical protein CBF30_09070 [Vagococcus entomophilus]|uniref:TIGR01906 family membrane protein n=1 Tax=Vagococcus entomophilus TaxID=1160095 RepID=A0A430AHM2_9ENTE|nr:hypothetical protein CBF30_09070 [Vagococcus entomophilus]
MSGLLKLTNLFRGKVGFLCLFLFLIALVITITINFYPLYVVDSHVMNLADSAGLTQKQLLLNYKELMHYLNWPFQKVLKLSNFTMSNAGRQHFVDVKRLFLFNYFILGITAVPAGFFLRDCLKSKRLWRLIRPFQIGSAVPFLLGFIMILGFERFFVLFHELLFSNDNWVFNPATDPIILVLPEDYFMHCFILAFVLFEGLMLGGVVLGKKSMKR